MTYRCPCGEIADERIEWCSRCGRIKSFFPTTRRVHRSRPQGPAVVTGMDLVRRSKRNLIWPGLMQQILPDGILVPSLLLLFGRPGVGKTTIAVQAADAWPKGPVLVLPFETGLGPSLSKLVGRLEAVKPDFALTDSWDEILELVPKYSLVVVDSLQTSGADPVQWRDITVQRGITLLLISEVNTDGEVRGGLAAGHLADTVIELPIFGEFKVRKNRAGDVGEGRWD